MMGPAVRLQCADGIQCLYAALLRVAAHPVATAARICGVERGCGGSRSFQQAITVDTLRGARKGDLQQKCCGTS